MPASCSRTCLKSIIYNLLSNAIKYRSPQRNPIVEFKTEMSHDCLCLLIKDNGLGIDLQRNKQKLFSIFKRFHDHVEGAGIGLYTVKKLVEKFEGNIDVESEPGVGTTFRINFRSGKNNYSAAR
ncbi:MAG: GHKL domain-containing protein [Cytophagaceae bacterium]|nr:GHKL domain-containing protein [Cytophagaceae bacterium]